MNSKPEPGLLDRLPRLTRGGRRRAYMSRLAHTLDEGWSGFELPEPDPAQAGLRVVECTECPKFARFPARCTVPFGSKLRSCITASTEYHLRGLQGKRALEIGCGESSFARHVIEHDGGRWIGLDQVVGPKADQFVHSILASVPEIPFKDESFDMVFGIQTIEHFGDPFTPGDLDCSTAFDAIWRILKPGGWVYFDGPIHLHGAPDFIRGNLAKIRAVFEDAGWCNVDLVSWRKKHGPLKAARAPQRESERWVQVLGEGAAAEIEELKDQTSWILAIRAQKPE